MDWSLAIAAATLELVVLTSAITVVWKIARSEATMRADFNKALADLSGKVYQTEIWSRDEFVRKGSFEIVIVRMEKGFTDLRAEIGGRLDKVSEKIDAMRAGHG